MDYSDLDQETKRRLNDQFGIDARGDEEVSKRTASLGRVLNDVSRLSKKDALWVLNRAVEFVVPSAFFPTEDDKARALSMEDVVRSVCQFYGVNFQDVIGEGRPARIVEARQMAMYILSLTGEYTLQAIGMTFGGRTPATISYAFNKVAKEAESRRSIRDRVKEICLRLGRPERKDKRNETD